MKWDDAKVGLAWWRRYFEFVENRWLKYDLKGRRKKKKKKR